MYQERLLLPVANGTNSADGSELKP